MSGETWLPTGERLRSTFDVAVAIHDYGHLGWYARRVRVSDRIWTVEVRWGRQTKMRCCYVRKRNGVPEADPGATWKPRKMPSERKDKQKLQLVS